MSNQLHWHDGLFLLPHHLQYLQHGLSSDISAVRRQTFSYSHGVLEAEISQDELANFRLRFDKLSAIMPSGRLVSAYHNADLPDLDLKPLFATGESTLLIHLAIPLWHAKRGNCFEIGAHVDPRVKLAYIPREVTLADENTGENLKPLFVRHLNARLVTEHEDRSDIEILPLLRINRTVGENQGTPRIDFEFIPPCIYLESSPSLYKKIRDLVGQIEASARELGVILTRGGFSLETIRGVQYEQLLRFRTLRRSCARLNSLLIAPRITPFDWYLELKSLYAEITALHPELSDYEVADYNQDDLFRAFNDLDVRIRAILQSAVGASFLRLDFTAEEGMLTAQLTDEHTTRPVEYYLAIKSKIDPHEIIRLVEDPDRFKFMPRSLANRAVRGVVLKEERVAPLQLPAQAGLTYFRCLRPQEGARIWQQIQAEKSVIVRWPDQATTDFQVTLFMTIVG